MGRGGLEGTQSSITGSELTQMRRRRNRKAGGGLALGLVPTQCGQLAVPDSVIGWVCRIPEGGHKTCETAQHSRAYPHASNLRPAYI
ncbi:uncharacterized protein LAJ45_05677 [Morchella importuna]|uniref:uncharacterized protein n=1 Tax=Morchella importuna TaxID=1174673 RepID=UPI001E8ED115|nr:uncharacterized protein LAJ45_05677 [Morchella importuna]KAH8150464.1 hypothetical protein LAJ45_05677 [Morchella importuna]